MNLYIEPTTKGQYNAYFNNDLIVEDSLQPGLDACRILQERGLQGKLDVYTKGSEDLRFSLNIKLAAQFCIKNDRFTPHNGK